MRAANLLPDSITMVSLLTIRGSGFTAMSSAAASVHVSGLVQPWSIYCARKCFDIMPEHGSVSWTANIAGYGSHGKGEAALQMSSEFLQSGLAPNDVIFFIRALYACNHNKLVDSGMVLFE
ncbi:hypothetical protein C2S51_032395 [Perilla frutescens var. frutescens]|nr:hypothetical protein C2S51_032395 [Perilla frutescens var. frutescens]